MITIFLIFILSPFFSIFQCLTRFSRHIDEEHNVSELDWGSSARTILSQLEIS
ncbi:hypothetical protein BSFP_068680 [Burkholderia stabilis]|uniref:Uncharacterized protein n=1 Tax=Burkholderia stabilis TaxID=95485 RepID=A0A1Y1BW18_9BURK|nr:hypothetical protein BSFP_068680 [Burkholderia stabilis]